MIFIMRLFQSFLAVFNVNLLLFNGHFRPLKVRLDEAEIFSKQAILACASQTEEGYFVAPPGNIPVEPERKDFWKVVESSGKPKKK
jgi:hypothetical protein